MFAQMIRGKVSDPSVVRPVVERWVRELGPTAKGWLGSTSGITDDSELFLLARFESEEAAKANSDKPEQGEWWAEMEKLFNGEATFRDSNDVEVESVGDLDSAGFVQVVVAKSKDLDRSKALTNSLREGRIDYDQTFSEPLESPSAVGSLPMRCTSFLSMRHVQPNNATGRWRRRQRWTR